MSAEIESLTAELAEARRTARIAEANESRDAFAEFKAMVDSLPAMPDGEERYQLRARIAAELRRLIESATAIGTELTITLKGSAFHRIDLLIDRAKVASLRLSITGRDYAFLLPREDLFGNVDMAARFAQFLGTGAVRIAA